MGKKRSRLVIWPFRHDYFGITQTESKMLYRLPLGVQWIVSSREFGLRSRILERDRVVRDGCLILIRLLIVPSLIRIVEDCCLVLVCLSDLSVAGSVV